MQGGEGRVRLESASEGLLSVGLGKEFLSKPVSLGLTIGKCRSSKCFMVMLCSSSKSKEEKV